MFFNKKRVYIPIMYYKNSKAIGKIVDPEEFPMEYMNKTCLILRRLKDMGIIESKKFQFYSVPKIIEILNQAGFLTDPSLPEKIDTVGIVFGRNYAGWWHRTEEGGDYLIPFQMVFYHDKRTEEYFLSRIELEKEREDTEENFFDKVDDSEFVLDLSMIKVKYTNTDDPEVIVNNAGPCCSDRKLMMEIRRVYLLTFSYLKYFLLLKKERMGYTSFISWLSDSLIEAEQGVLELSQYFGMNTDCYAAMADVLFERLVLQILGEYEYSLECFASSPKSMINWMNNCLLRFGISELDFEWNETTGREFNRLEAIRKFQERINPSGLQIWAFYQSDILSSMVLVIMKGDSKDKDGEITDSKGASVTVPQGLHVERFGDDFVKKYAYLAEEEGRRRKLAEKLYPLIGVKDLQEAQQNIAGDRVLDPYLYEKGYVVNIDGYEDTVTFALAGLLEACGLYSLATRIEEAVIPPEIKRYGYIEDFTGDDYEITPVERMALYAALLRQHGKLLCYLNLQSGSYHFILADHKTEIRIKLERILRELDEVANFLIL